MASSPAVAAPTFAPSQRLAPSAASAASSPAPTTISPTPVARSPVPIVPRPAGPSTASPLRPGSSPTSSGLKRKAEPFKTPYPPVKMAAHSTTGSGPGPSPSQQPAQLQPQPQRQPTTSRQPVMQQQEQPPPRRLYENMDMDNIRLFGYPVPTYGGRPVNWRPVITADQDRGLIRRYFLPPDVTTLKKVATRIGGRLDAVMPFGFPKDFSIHSPPLTVFDVESDGNCLFRAISLYLLGSETYFRAFRKLACDTIDANKTTKWVDDLGGGNGNLPIEERITEMRKDARHLNDHVRWGGSLEMAALALALDMNIFCYEEDNISKRVWQTYAPETTQKTSFILPNLKKRFSVALLHGKHHFKAVVAIA